jgi:hypothetical protein
MQILISRLLREKSDTLLYLIQSMQNLEMILDSPKPSLTLVMARFIVPLDGRMYEE